MLSGTHPYLGVCPWQTQKKCDMGKWSQSQIYQDTRGTNRFTRFVGWLNNLMNPNHSWVDDWQQFSEDVGPSEDIEKQITKSGLTGAEKEANAFSAAEAQKQRDYETEMQNTAYQRQVADMRAAGVNPALAMSNGQPSTPSGSSASSVSPSGAGISMSDLMQLNMLPLQRKMLEAQTANVGADTAKKEAETEEAKNRAQNVALVNQYYPSVTEAGLQKTLSSIGVDLSTIDKNDAEVALTNVRKLIADKENKYADEYYHWRSEYEKAHTQEAKDAAAAHAAQALMTGYELEFAQKNGAKLSSSSILALASAIGSWLGLDTPENRGVVQRVVRGATEDIGNPKGMLDKAADQAEKLGLDDRSIVRKGKRLVDRFRRWRDKPKKAPWVR